MPTLMYIIVTFKLLPIDIEYDKKLWVSSNTNHELFEFINNKNMIKIYRNGGKIKSEKFVGFGCICPKVNLTLKNNYWS